MGSSSLPRVQLGTLPTQTIPGFCEESRGRKLNWADFPGASSVSHVPGAGEEDQGELLTLLMGNK